MEWSWDNGLYESDLQDGVDQFEIYLLHPSKDCTKSSINCAKTSVDCAEYSVDCANLK